MAKQYDIILFGVTGFTGKLAAEYLLEKTYNVKWAASARSINKAKSVLTELSSVKGAKMPEILEADLVCETDEQKEILRNIVSQTKVVLTCSGPFEIYSQTLVGLCAELGVHYADITGETDFFRQTIEKQDSKAQKSGAVILCHCGNDCIPCDLTVYEMHKYAKGKGFKLKEAMTYEEFSESASLSGGTAATATFQLGKHRNTRKTSFDPLLMTVEGEQSKFSTKNISGKKTVPVPDVCVSGKEAGPWIMGPVMVNCVRRSNALLGYSENFSYGDVAVKFGSFSAWARNTLLGVKMAAAVTLPSLFSRFLPKPGQGPVRSDMEDGFLKLHGQGTMVSNDGEQHEITTKFQFNKDTGYLYTAALLVETGILLVEKSGDLRGGVQTPAVALGSSLTNRILKEMDTSFEIKDTS